MTRLLRTLGVHRVMVALAAVLACGCLASQADAFVYWSGNMALGRANLDGSGVNQNLLGVGLGLGGVAVDGQHIYWSNYEAGTIGRANLDGSGADQNLITGAGSPEGVAVDGQHVYWTNSVRDTIGRANLDGSGVDQNFITSVNVPYGVAVDGKHVYWADLEDSTIGRANLDGSGVDQSFITGANDPFGVAVDGQHVYWTNSSSVIGTIGRANLDGSNVDQSFIAGADTFGVAVDGQHIYWANGTFGTIGRANLDGSGREESFVTGAGRVGAVAVDALPLPPLASITTPASGVTYAVGQAVDSSFTCSDGAGGPGIASCLDQGGHASGAAIDTSTPGPHTFTVTATSNDGRTGQVSSTYTVRARGPVLSNLRASHSRWREGSALAKIISHAKRTRTRAAVGTTFSFTLNQAATVNLSFTQQASGRVVKTRGHEECVAQTRHNRRRLTCTRTVTAGSLSLKVPSGADQILFAGRVSPTHRLRVGHYTVTITAANVSGESTTPQSLRFTIVK